MEQERLTSATWTSGGENKGAREVAQELRRANPMNQLHITEVLRHLPHRYPFLLIDRVVSVEPGKELVALKTSPSTNPSSRGTTRIIP